jgi:hypothetical protein
VPTCERPGVLEGILVWGGATKYHGEQLASLHRGYQLKLDVMGFFDHHLDVGHLGSVNDVLPLRDAPGKNGAGIDVLEPLT